MRKLMSMFILIMAMMLVISACAGQNGDQNANDGLNETDITDELGEDNESGLSDEQNSDESDGSEEDDIDAPVDGEDIIGDGDDEFTGTKLELIVSTILEAVEQRPTMELEEDMMKDMYYIDPELIEEFAIHMPMFNISTNEFAVFKVKDRNDIPAVEEGITLRATDVQISFEKYLPDQYENAKNFKIVVEEDYVLFVIDNEETANHIIEVFQSFFGA